MKNSVIKAIAKILPLVLGMAVAVRAGDLNPPPGPVTSTMKTLVEVEPRTPISSLPLTITDSGSYYLAGNLIGTVDADGITISADDVTLDLNGFALVGVPGSRDGVSVPATQVNLTIRNGTVRNWGEDGIDAFNANNSTLEGCHASNNRGYGLRVGNGSAVTNCTSRSNGGNGFNVGEGSTISYCTSTLNIGSGFELGGLTTIIGCTARGNGTTGISAAESNTVVNCTSSDNTGAGITAGDGSSIIACNARENGGSGISVGGGCTVAQCTTRKNGGDGIALVRGYALNNNCERNGFNGDGAGIHVSEGREARLEGNNVTGNDRGIDVDSSGNLIIKNSARGNGVNYAIVDGNDVGPIGSASSSTSPWANIEF